MRMLHRALACAALALALPLPSVAHGQAMSAEEMAAVQLALDRGQLLYAYDQAAWHGTDDFRAKAQTAGTWDVLGARSGGWIVDGSAGAPEIVFYDRDRANPEVLYVARFTDGGTRLVESRLVSPDEPSPLTPERRRLIDAQRAAYEAIAATDSRLCADARPNTVVLPPAMPSDPVLVYFLTPQTETGKYPLGGHYRVEVAPDGTAGPIRPFTKSCLTMDVGENRPVALQISHLLDPTPTEIHVFFMFATKLPLYVATTSNGRLWAVESSAGQARIRTMESEQD
jgi:hypothetical protein